ncbi:MAG: oxidoreductase [Rhodovulum sp.]|nr:oxidoreductase [Rhodovulum sp.]
MTIKAVIINKQDDVYSVAPGELNASDLMDGDTLVRVSHSSVNYKDGLAVTNRAPVVRRFPMVPGIDMVGVIEETTAPGLAAGDAVILNGWGTGETHLGAWAKKSRVPGAWLVPLPKDLSAEQAAAIGTAGYTAALCVLGLQDAGVTPASGPVLVTGAAGGVGSVAIALLGALGYHVIASTGRPDEADYLKKLGANEIIARDELSGKLRALGKERWAGAVDSVGSTTLANVLSMTRYGGTVTCCGLAGGMDLPSSVAPFILRGVSLIGVDSVMAAREKRLRAWELLDQKLDRKLLAEMTTVVPLSKAIEVGEQIVDGKVRGRVVVTIV